MSEFAIEVLNWLPLDVEDPVERETFASLQINVGCDSIAATEVEDTVAKSIRRYVNVSAYSLARWLLVNWWRLRWEPYRDVPPLNWLQSHSLASIGGGFAWPPLTLCSDGEFVRVRIEAEQVADVSAVRYLKRFNIDVPASHFERAVDGFLDAVEARLAVRAHDERRLTELREELRSERGDPERSLICRLEAMAGIDPGAAPKQWLRVAKSLADSTGDAAAEEVAAIAPALSAGLATAESIVSVMRASPVTAKLDWTAQYQPSISTTERPWERGGRLAGEVRASLGLSSGPISDDRMKELLGVSLLPLPKTECPGSRDLHGGFRNDGAAGPTTLLVHSARPDSQRFHLARLIGASIAAQPGQHLLPVTSGATALQKFERSFAQEFLCPWRDLEEFTESCGMDDDGIADAAEHFAVSEMLVLTTLVNKGKLPRDRLGA